MASRFVTPTAPPTVALIVPDDREEDFVRVLSGAGLTIASEEADVIVVCGGPGAVRAAAEGTEARIVAAVDDADRRTSTELLDAGAQGVVIAADAESLAPAVLAVAAGLVVVPEPGRHAVRRPVLTARQKQILSLLVLGLSNGDIANRLYLSEATVKTHLTGIFGKLGVRSRKEATDLILDPLSGLGTGILGISLPERTQTGYGAPRIGSG